MIAKIIVMSEMEDDGLKEPSGAVIVPSGKNVLFGIRSKLIKRGAKVGEIEHADGRIFHPWTFVGLNFISTLTKDDAIRLEVDAKLSLTQKLFKRKTAKAMQRAISVLVEAVNEVEGLDAIQVTRF
jgi:hypothetical protein